ncbi:MAG: hypothetical protein K8J09_03265 [Planctomycetes bacterium]|nr:hypothetical protein [Planctomycetota bacterium]
MRNLPRRGALFAAPLLLPTLLSAQTWTETAAGAGQTWSTSETPLGSGPLTRIQGTIDAGRAADIYLVRVDDLATFQVSTVGGANFDTQLWMFGADGIGLGHRDDDVGSGLSTLTGYGPYGPGTVLIAVSEYDNDPLDQNGDQLWNDTPYDTERWPDGPGAANPFTQWSGTSSTARPYTLTLRGASFAAEVNPAETQVALAWVQNPPTSGPAPFLSYQHTPSGELIVTERLGVGYCRVLLPGHLGDKGNLQVTSAEYPGTSDFITVVESYLSIPGKMLCDIRTFDAAGQPADGDFNLVYRVGGRPTDRTAYLWAHDPTAASYTPATGYAFNGNRGNPTIVRTGVGVYRVTLPGLASGANGGHVQVSPIASGIASRAQVDSWSSVGADQSIYVRTFDGAGNAADRMFLLSYTETAAAQAPHLGAGAFLWANSPTQPSYVPSLSYQESNGISAPASPITITRAGVGTYDVELPTHQSFLGVPIVGIYGATPGAASVRDWSNTPAGGTVIRVECKDTNYNLSDRQFVLQFTSAHPAGTPARNDVIGGSCNGSTLRGVSRPSLGGTWELALDSLPPTATLGFTILGVGGPNLPLDGLGMPGCVLNADLTLLGIFVGNPAVALNVPNSLSLVGAALHAQAGAFEPTLNAFGAGFGNAIRGVIGDV